MANKLFHLVHFPVAGREDLVAEPVAAGIEGGGGGGGGG